MRRTGHPANGRPPFFKAEAEPEPLSATFPCMILHVAMERRLFNRSIVSGNYVNQRNAFAYCALDGPNPRDVGKYLQAPGPPLIFLLPRRFLFRDPWRPKTSFSLTRT